MRMNLKYEIKMRWYSFLSKLKGQKIIEYEGVTIRVDTLNYIVRGQLYSKTYEKDEIYLIKKYVDKNSTVLEFGAGIGVTSCIINNILSNNYKPKQVSYEAVFDVCQELSRNKRLNRSKFVARNYAVVDSNSERKIYISDGSDLLRRDRNIRRTHVNLSSIQSLEQLDNYDTLIMDIEGWEIDVLKESNLDKYKTIIVEFHPDITDTKDIEDTINLLLKKFNLVENVNNNFVFIKK